MTWAVEWSEVCEGDVRRMPWPVAARICKAVLELADGNIGTVEQRVPHDRNALRVRVPGAAALIQLDPGTRTVLVWRLYATH